MPRLSLVSDLAFHSGNTAMHAQKGTAAEIARFQKDALHAAVAAIDLLDRALDRLQSAWAVLPEGEEKAKLEKEKVRLAFALYEARLTTLRLFPSSELPQLDSVYGEDSKSRV